MSAPMDGFTSAHPCEQGRLGQDVEEILLGLAVLADQAAKGPVEDERCRALRVAGFAAIQLSYLAERSKEIGHLCPTVERELALAESILARASELTLVGTLSEKERSLLDVENGWKGAGRPMTRAEYIPALMRLSHFIRERFPRHLRVRWREFAREAAGKEPLRKRSLL